MWVRMCFGLVLVAFICDRLEPGYMMFWNPMPMLGQQVVRLKNPVHFWTPPPTVPSPSPGCRTAKTDVDRILKQQGVGCWK